MNITAKLNEHFEKRSRAVKTIFREFMKPIYDNVFFNNLEYLRSNSDIYSFDKDKWYMKPYVFAHDIYGEQYYYPVVMLVNNIRTMFDFVPEKMEKIEKDGGIMSIILAPKLDAIKKII